MIAGLAAATTGRVVVGRPRRHGRAAVPARHGRRVPELRAVPAYDGRRQRRVRAARCATSPRPTASRRVTRRSASCGWPGSSAVIRAQLSGGQQQRVALARALVIQPQILLFDEPLSNLDAKLREEMRSEIRDIQRRLGITALFVTHDQAEALAMCDKVAVMNGGRLEQYGTPVELYEQPAESVRRLIRRAHQPLSRRLLTAAACVSARTRCASPGPRAAHVEVMVRPHRIRIGGVGGPGRESPRRCGQARHLCRRPHRVRSRCRRPDLRRSSSRPQRRAQPDAVGIGGRSVLACRGHAGVSRTAERCDGQSTSSTQPGPPEPLRYRDRAALADRADRRAVFLAPIINLLRISFNEALPGGGIGPNFTWDNWIKLAEDSYYLEIVLRTVGMSLLITLLTLLCSYPIALYLHRARGALAHVPVRACDLAAADVRGGAHLWLDCGARRTPD